MATKLGKALESPLRDATRAERARWLLTTLTTPRPGVKGWRSPELSPYMTYEEYRVERKSPALGSNYRATQSIR